MARLRLGDLMPGSRLFPRRRSVPWARVLAGMHAGYFVTTGIWAVLHRSSFERVTGSKRDYWLVRLVGGLAAAIGAVLAVAVARGRPSAEARMLAAGSAVAFGAADLYAGVRSSRLYLLDLVLQAVVSPVWWRRWR